MKNHGEMKNTERTVWVLSTSCVCEHCVTWDAEISTWVEKTEERGLSLSEALESFMESGFLEWDEGPHPYCEEFELGLPCDCHAFEDCDCCPNEWRDLYPKKY